MSGFSTDAAMLQQATAGLQAAAKPQARATADPAQARETAEDFEAFFVTMVVEAMYAGIETDGMFGGGNGEQVFRSMMFQEYGKSIANAGGFGLADNVYREILRQQEAQS